MTLFLYVWKDGLSFIGVVVLKSKAHKDFGEILVFFFHFLMMRSALLCLSGFYKSSHGFKDPVSSTEMFVKEVLMM